MSKVNDGKKLFMNDPAVQNALKEVYLPTIRDEAFTNAGALSEAFGRGGLGQTVNDQAAGLEVFIKRGTLGAVGAAKDGMTLLGHGSKFVGGDRFRIKSKMFTGTMTVQHETMLRTATDAASFVNWFEDQASYLQGDLQRSFGRQLYGTSDGEVATLVGAAVAETYDGYPTVKMPVSRIEKFMVGEIVSFEGLWDGTPASVSEFFFDKAFKIIDIDYQYGAIVIDATADNVTGQTGNVIGTAELALMAADTVIYYNLSKGGELHGLKDLLGTTNYFGIGTNSGSLDKFSSAFVAGTRRPGYLTPQVTEVFDFAKEDLLMKHRDDTALRNNGMPTFMVTTNDTIRSYASYPNVQTNRINRDSGASAMGDVRSLGYKGIDLLGEAVFADRFADKERIYFLDLSSFGMVMLEDLTWDSFEHGTIWKQMTDAGGRPLLSWRADLTCWKDLYSEKPHANSFIEYTSGPKVGMIGLDGSVTTRDSAPLGTGVNPETGAIIDPSVADVVTDQSVSQRKQFDVEVNPDTDAVDAGEDSPIIPSDTVSGQ